MDALLAGTVVGHVAQCGSCLLRGLSGTLLRVHLGHLQYGERIANMHVVALLNLDFNHSAGQLARHAILVGIHLALYHFVLGAEGEETNHGHHDDHGSESKHCQQNVVMLCFG